jgi:hypothetical protein
VVCTAPASNPGNVSIEVSNNGLDFTKTGLRFSFREAVALTLVPSRGPVMGGSFVTILGLEVSGPEVRSLTFGSARVLLESTEGGTVRMAVPAGSYVGLVNVITDDLGGGLPMVYEYHEIIRVHALKPSSGSIAGGTRIVVSGEGFDGDDGFCRFGDEDDMVTPIVSVLSSNAVICVTPQRVAAGIATLEVSLNGGTSSSTDKVQFQYYSEPVLLQAMPSYAPATGGSSITFAGDNFVDSSDFLCRFA